MHEANLEAIGWIKTENVSDFAVNRFDHKSEAIEFIEKLYVKGAVEVTVNSASIIDESDGLYADAIIIKLPENNSKRDAVLHCIRTEESQTDSYVDVKGDSVYFFWD